MMRRCDFIIVMAILATCFIAGDQRCAATSASVDWSRTFSSSGSVTFNSVAVDVQGNIYTVGDTEGSEAAGPALGGTDALLIKYNVSGTRVAAVQFGTAKDDGAWAVACDASGNIYVLGQTDGNYEGTNEGDTDIFIAKFSPDLTVIWKKQYGTDSYDDVGGLTLDIAGHVWVCGNTAGRLFGQGEINYTQSTYVIELDASGNQMLGQQFATSCPGMTATDIGLDGSGNVYLTGSGSEVFNDLQGGGNVFIAKFSPQLNLIWGWQFGGEETSQAHAIAVDPTGHAVVGGVKNLGMVAGVSETDFIAKFNPDGTQAWLRTTSETARGGVTAVVLGQNGEVYIAGGKATEPFNGENTKEDFYVVKYSSSGNQVWDYTAGTSGVDGASSIRLTSAGKVLVVGDSDGGLFGMPSGEHAYLLQLNQP